MDGECHPIIMWSALGPKFTCTSTPAHRDLWVKLPEDFDTADMAAVHDRLVGLFPNGGTHKL
jgi:hypothetical protein